MPPTPFEVHVYDLISRKISEDIVLSATFVHELFKTAAEIATTIAGKPASDIPIADISLIYDRLMTARLAGYHRPFQSHSSVDYSPQQPRKK